MAQLTAGDKDALAAELESFFSSRWDPIDITSDRLRAGIDIFDAQLETTESNILSSIGAAAQAWLTSHPKLSRYILERVAQKRREEL